MASPKKGAQTVDKTLLKVVWAIDLVLVVSIIIRGAIVGGSFSDLFDSTMVAALVKIVSAIYLVTLIAIVHSWVTKKVKKDIILGRFVQFIGAFAIFIFAFAIGKAIIDLF